MYPATLTPKIQYQVFFSFSSKLHIVLCSKPSDNPTQTSLSFALPLAFSREIYTVFSYLPLLPPWGRKAAEVLMEELKSHSPPASGGICSTVIACKAEQTACKASVCYGALPRRNACQVLQKFTVTLVHFCLTRGILKSLDFIPHYCKFFLPAEVLFLLGNTLQIGAALQQSREAQSASSFCQGNAFKGFTLHLTLLVKGPL